jgi:ribokinase
MGDQAVRGFLKEGICTDAVFRDKSSPSGVALIFVGAAGENSIAVAPGANSRLTPADLRKAKEALICARALLVQLETPIETVRTAVAMASQAGVPVILNPAPAQPLPDDLLQKVAILTPNESEAEAITGIKITSKAGAKQAAKCLLERGAQAVVITMGSRGALLASREAVRFLPSFKVRAVDTIAAGDTFNGALAVALAEGKPLLDAVRFAQAAAALSVTRPGAQDSTPRRKEIERFLKGPFEKRKATRR